jgi:hypothetical protein
MTAIADTAVGSATARIPTEFDQYWRALERPGVKRLRALTRGLLGFDLVPSEARVREWAHGCYDADPVAEAFVDGSTWAAARTTAGGCSTGRSRAGSMRSPMRRRR